MNYICRQDNCEILLRHFGDDVKALDHGFVEVLKFQQFKVVVGAFYIHILGDEYYQNCIGELNLEITYYKGETNYTNDQGRERLTLTSHSGMLSFAITIINERI